MARQARAILHLIPPPRDPVEVVEAADLTRATLVPLWPPDTTTTPDTVGPRPPAGTLTPRPPVTTSTTEEDIPSTPRDLGPTLGRDHRAGRLLLLPVHQEHRLLLYLNLTISTRYGLQKVLLILCVCVGFFALLV